MKMSLSWKKCESRERKKLVAPVMAFTGCVIVSFCSLIMGKAGPRNYAFDLTYALSMYFLLSPGLKREWRLPGWAVVLDFLAVVTFSAFFFACSESYYYDRDVVISLLVILILFFFRRTVRYFSVGLWHGALELHAGGENEPLVCAGDRNVSQICVRNWNPQQICDGNPDFQQICVRDPDFLEVCVVDVDFLEVCTIVEEKDAPDLESGEMDIIRKLDEYFERAKPFLDPDLTMEQVARALYTNRAYVSSAINHCTHYNFCKFVNRYRVKYAVGLFLSNKALRVQELAVKSGFNSTHTFTMAFRLYMNMNPSEWCRANRNLPEDIVASEGEIPSSEPAGRLGPAPEERAT